MASVTLTNKQFFQKFSNSTLECLLKGPGKLLYPQPEFQVSGLDPDAMYQMSMTFQQVSQMRFDRKTQKWESRGSFTLDYDEQEVIKGPVIGSDIMKESIKFDELRITNKISSITDQIVFLNPLHKYIPIVKLYTLRASSFEQISCAQFAFEEAAFVAVTKWVTNQPEPIVQSLPISNIATDMLLISTVSQRTQNQSVISVSLPNRSEYLKFEGNLERRVFKNVLLSPSIEFLITGLNPTDHYQVSLSFQRIGDFKLRHEANKWRVTTTVAEKHEEKDIEHRLRTVAGLDLMKNSINFDWVRITSKRKDINDHTVLLHTSLRYIPVLKIVQVEPKKIEPMTFFFEETVFVAVSNYSKCVQNLKTAMKSRKRPRTDTDLMKPIENAYQYQINTQDQLPSSNSSSSSSNSYAHELTPYQYHPYQSENQAPEYVPPPYHYQYNDYPYC